MKEIYDIANWEELICPKHHIQLVYRNENDELILKCPWCDFTLIPVIDKDRKCRICGK